jgi:hypothetical protein
VSTAANIGDFETRCAENQQRTKTPLEAVHSFVYVGNPGGMHFSRRGWWPDTQHAHGGTFDMSIATGGLAALPPPMGIADAVFAEPASIPDSRAAGEVDFGQDPDGSRLTLLQPGFDDVDVDHKNFYVVPEPAVMQAILGEKAMIAGVRTGPRYLAGADTVAPDEPHGKTDEVEHIREDEVADNSEVLFIRSPVLVFLPSSQAQAVFDAVKALKVTVRTAGWASGS